MPHLPLCQLPSSLRQLVCHPCLGLPGGDNRLVIDQRCHCCDRSEVISAFFVRAADNEPLRQCRLQYVCLLEGCASPADLDWQLDGGVQELVVLNPPTEWALSFSGFLLWSCDGRAFAQNAPRRFDHRLLQLYRY